MAIAVEYRLKSKHRIENQNGFIRAIPAFPQDSRLYVIVNASTGFPVYVGTTENVSSRFKERFSAIRACGFPSQCTDPIGVMVFQMLINDRPSPPGDSGISGGVDVEHIFIRTYIKLVNVRVRNMNKINEYTNRHGTALHLEWTDPDGIGWVGPGRTGRYTIDSGGHL